MLQGLPYVAPWEEHLAGALRRAGKVSAPGGRPRAPAGAAAARSLAAQHLDALTKEVAVPLRVYCRGFPDLGRIPPFERALVELTLGEGKYERAVERVNRMRVALLETGKGYAARAGRAGSKQEAQEVLDEGLAAVERVFRRDSGALQRLQWVAMELRRLPVLDPTVPTVALVGAPNVGKSSLVRVLSSGKPEVNSYPFTTKGIQMGHFDVQGRRHQVTDTPGLLPQSPARERNSMERLTLATLEHLPTAVLFVLDLTRESGTAVAEQLAVRAELRERFQGKPWVDVFSKADLVGIGDALGGEGLDEGAGAARAAVPGALQVSAAEGLGVPALRSAVEGMLQEPELLDSVEAMGGTGGSDGGGVSGEEEEAGWAAQVDGD